MTELVANAWDAGASLVEITVPSGKETALVEQGVTQSMSRKGNCLDNAAMKNFFGTLKLEFFHLNEFSTLAELRAGIKRYIHYYNNHRIKLKTERA